MSGVDLEAWRVVLYDDGWRLEHDDCGWASNFQDGHRTVADLHRWIDNHTCEPNKPTGFVLRKTWGEVPAGWFVRPPNGGDWWEVLAREGDTFTLRGPGGREGTWPRNPAEDVMVRKGTSTKARDDALAALNAAGFSTHIIEDQVS